MFAGKKKVVVLSEDPESSLSFFNHLKQMKGSDSFEQLLDLEIPNLMEVMPIESLPSFSSFSSSSSNSSVTSFGQMQTFSTFSSSKRKGSSTKKLSFQDPSLFIVMVRLEQESSLSTIKTIWNRTDHRGVPCLVLGLSAHLRYDPSFLCRLSKLGNKMVNLSELVQWVTEIGAIYIECSLQMEMRLKSVMTAISEFVAPELCFTSQVFLDDFVFVRKFSHSQLSISARGEGRLNTSIEEMKASADSDEQRPIHAYVDPFFYACEQKEGEWIFPEFISQCLEYLKNYAPTTKGIFRVKHVPFSTVTRTVQNIRQSDKKMPLEEHEGNDVFLCAAVLHRYLREASAPICGWGFYHAALFIERLSHQPNISKKQITNLHSHLFSLIPPPNSLFLSKLLSLYHSVSLNHEVNLMTSKNLAVCVSPNLVKRKDDDLMAIAREIGPLNSFFEYAIKNAPEICVTPKDSYCGCAFANASFEELGVVEGDLLFVRWKTEKKEEEEEGKKEEEGEGEGEMMEAMNVKNEKRGQIPRKLISEFLLDKTYNFIPPPPLSKNIPDPPAPKAVPSFKRASSNPSSSNPDIKITTNFLCEKWDQERFACATMLVKKKTPLMSEKHFQYRPQPKNDKWIRGVISLVSHSISTNSEENVRSFSSEFEKFAIELISNPFFNYPPEHFEKLSTEEFIKKKLEIYTTLHGNLFAHNGYLTVYNQMFHLAVSRIAHHRDSIEILDLEIETMKLLLLHLSKKNKK